jgi:hypothetical protein
MWSALLLSPWVVATSVTALTMLWLAHRSHTETAWWSTLIELARPIARAPRAAGGVARRPPADVVCAAAALLACGLALGWPRGRADRAPETWTVHVDSSPSMHLAWALPGETPTESAPTRLERALDMVRSELRSRVDPDDRVLWRRVLDGVPQVHSGPWIPAAWLEAPRRPQDAPLWAAVDRPGHLWVSDDAQGIEPRFARACLSGGTAISGPVAAVGSRRLVGTPEGLRLDPRERSAPRLLLERPADCPALQRVLEAWCAERGVLTSRGPEADLVIATAEAAAGESPPVRAVGKGWSWQFAGPRGRPQGVAWLSDGLEPLVSWVPGRIEFAGAPHDEPFGDPASFAAAWSDLLDRACLAPHDVISTAERAFAGAPRSLGEFRPPLGGAGEPARRAPAVLALMAAVLAGAGVWVARPLPPFARRAPLRSGRPAPVPWRLAARVPPSIPGRPAPDPSDHGMR